MLMETSNGMGSKVTSPFGMPVTLAFIDPMLMEDLCYIFPQQQSDEQYLNHRPTQI